MGDSRVYFGHFVVVSATIKPSCYINNINVENIVHRHTGGNDICVSLIFLLEHEGL